MFNFTQRKPKGAASFPPLEVSGAGDTSPFRQEMAMIPSRSSPKEKRPLPSETLKKILLDFVGLQNSLGFPQISKKGKSHVYPRENLHET